MSERTKEQLPSDPSIEWTRNGVPPLPSVHVERQALRRRPYAGSCTVPCDLMLHIVRRGRRLHQSRRTSARMGCDTKTAATVWAPSYKRATVMQASLAVVSFLAGALAWLLGGGILWLVGAVLIGLVVPFTFIAVMPTNHRLLAPGRDLASVETRALLEEWGRLHAVRSALSLVASVVYMALLFRA